MTPWHLLTTTATVFVPTVSASANGAPTWGDTTPGTTYTVQCAPVQPMSSNEAILFGRDATRTMYQVYMAPVTTSGAAYAITGIAKITVDGVAYDVVGGVQDQAGMGVLVKIPLERET